MKLPSVCIRLWLKYLPIYSSCSEDPAAAGVIVPAYGGWTKYSGVLDVRSSGMLLGDQSSVRPEVLKDFSSKYCLVAGL